MKKINLVLVALVVLFTLQFQDTYAKGKSESIRIATYNIRGDLPDGKNSWQFRKDSLCKIIKHHDFDIVAMQEVLANQLEDIQDRINYAFVGIRGLYNPIFYKADKFELLHTEMFWLSETMEPYAKGWDGKYERYCTWAKFKNRKTGEIFFVFNTHLDHKGPIAKREGAVLITKQMERFAQGYPVILTGDMNSFDTTDAYAAFAEKYKDARVVSPVNVGPEGTAHNFGGVPPVRIDYIFVNDLVKVNTYNVEDEQYPNGFYPSDHYAVFSDIQLLKK